MKVTHSISGSGANFSDRYERQIKGLVKEGSLWGAIKYSGVIHDTQIDGIHGYSLEDGTVVVLKNVAWEHLLSMANIDKDTLEPLEEPNFKTPEAASMKVGLFNEVFKRGYIVFPLEAMNDLQNHPIILRKGK